MKRRGRATLAYDDGIVCHRAGYSHLTPQACLERHVRNEDLCGTCRWHMVATDVMSEAMDSSPEEIVQITQSGNLGRHANPLIRPESRPDPEARAVLDADDCEKGKNVNTRVVFVNGRRIPQGVLVDFRSVGTLVERTLVAYFSKEFVERGKGIMDLMIDEYINGRLQIRYEWRSDDKETFGEPMQTKYMKEGKEVDVVGYRLFSITSDSFTRV